MKLEVFKKKFWRKKPALLRKLWMDFGYSSDSVFRGMRDAIQRNEFPDEIRLFGARGQPLGLPTYTSIARARNLKNYLENMRERLGKFSLVINGLERNLEDAHFEQLKTFIRSVMGAELPSGRIEANAFMGNYDSTHQGAHTDPAEVFAFVVLGTKKFRFWPRGLLSEMTPLASRIDYSSLKRESFVITAREGEIVYWPREYWHVAECDDQLSLSVSTSLYFDPDTSLMNVKIAQDFRTLFKDSWGPFLPHNEKELISRLAKTFTGWKKKVLSPDYQQQLLEMMLNHRTSLGFGPRRRRGQPAHFDLEMPYFKIKRGMILDWIDFKSGGTRKVVVSVNGRSARWPSQSGLLQLLKRVKSHRGRPIETRLFFSGDRVSLEFFKLLLDADAVEEVESLKSQIAEL